MTVLSKNTPINPRLCISTLGCPTFSLPEVANLAARHGIGSLELRCLSGQVIEPDNFNRTLPEPSTARVALEKQGLQIRVLSTSVRLFEPKPTSLETLLAFGRYADAVGAPWLRVFDGGLTGQNPTAAEWTAAAKLLTAWQAQRLHHGLQCDLAVETHWALTSAVVAKTFTQRFPSVALIWDTHHTWKNHVGLEDFWANVRRQVAHLHVKDSRADQASSAGWSYCLPGQGDFPWSELHALLRRDNYSQSVSLEWEKQWHPELVPLETALEAMQGLWPI